MAEQHKLWGGAFTKSPGEVAWRFGQSIESDLNLLNEEIEVSIAHAQMLGDTGIISAQEAAQLAQGLGEVGKDLAGQDLGGFEDVHAAVETGLKAKVGAAADKLHSGRSRNDQIATVSRLWLRNRTTQLAETVRAFQAVLVEQSEKFLNEPMPGYTHQQPAQPNTLGAWMLAHFWMLERDLQRLSSTSEMAMAQCPLGSGAMAGSTLPIDREHTSEKLGFGAPSASALDGVSDRDFVGDALHACAMLMQHLSRFSQEIVLFSTAEFGYVRLDDAISTGSSIMPQKRNPDFAELIRGRSARAIGNWVQFMGMMKALPLGYNRDQQDDKPPLFDSVALCMDSTVLCKEMLETATWNLPRLKEMATAGFSTATAVAESLVQAGMPFRQAHEAVGRLVLYCEKNGKTLDQLDAQDAKNLELPASSLEAATLDGALRAKKSAGSPGPEALAVQLQQAREALNN